MMITRESDYAVRMIRALKDGEQLTIEQICRKEQVPRQFAYKILKKLEKAGLVRIRRGAGGGCSLGRGLDVLTLLDVIRATDEEFFLNPCLKQGYRCEYAEGSGHNCLVHCELARVQAILERELRHKTLAELFC
ncbi:Rrf2 family transcriptional regulator [Enterocloster aldenensis]|uniref:RrF2 family transcriptional regulator n=1 Tax=Enterocloster aldenensis TaxID=358742 RepID=UPI000E4C7842|nr:Rrf2 family transcriptional regulator [Clostridium sp.]MCC3394543.1 Rrf2 family transcriptional regulator [Clostridiales bacterium AHG0011]RGC57288.1 Rrf2 family transcriptional regulator [Dorea longicatena]RHB38921.1 Rrf2 family transcriptional regulator [Enterocloster aldenensis]